MDVHTHRLKLLTSVGAVCLALSSFAPAAAQSGPTLGTWQNGPGASGTSTIVGRVESPRARQNLNPSASLLVSGWAADTTAAGWAGIDGVEVWNGTKDKGTKLASGVPALARADVGEALGGTFTNSGFSAVVPSSALQGLTGTQTLYVYLHTPGKGSYYRTASVNITTPPTFAFADDPIVTIIKPQEGDAITQKQRNSKYTFQGFALDRNATTVTDPNTLLGPGCGGCTLYSTQARGAGISSISAYIDTPPAKGDPSIFGSFGAACTGCLYNNPLVSNAGSLNVPGRPQASIITRQYGSQFDFSGWAISINPTTLTPDWHTLYVTATSSITGKQSTASVRFQVLDLNHTKIQ